MGLVRCAPCVLFLVCCSGDGVDSNGGEESADNAKYSQAANSAGAPDADITNVFAREDKDGSWTFHVSVAHPDIGFEDFADGWDLVTPSGDVIKVDRDQRFTKIVRHPHVKEQPFTRTQKGIRIPEGVRSVTVRAHDRLAGFGGEEVVVDLNQRFGRKFSVKRRLTDRM